ncbi:hypothetical protein [Slackia exigua]
MAIILSHSSALAFWTNVRIGRSRAFYEGCKIVPACSSPLPSARATQKELARLAMVFKPSALDALALRDDMHVLVKQGRHNDKVRGIRAHSTTHDFSSRVFFQIAPDVFAVSPALCFCQMGEMLDPVDMIRLGDELCGKYAVLRDEIAFSIEPLVRRATLARRLRELPSAYGRARAVQAMRYVVDDSASPRETVLEIMLALPRCKGGFGFSTPEMNGIIKVGRGPWTALELFGDVKTTVSRSMQGMREIGALFPGGAHASIPDRFKRSRKKQIPEYFRRGRRAASKMLEEASSRVVRF